MTELPKGPMPPHAQLRDFLPAAELQDLLDWTLANAARFEPARLTGDVLDPERRRAGVLRDIGPLAPMLRARFRAALPEMFRGAGTPLFAPVTFELELAAHGDGAFFALHRDIPIGPRRSQMADGDIGRYDRLLSAVLYYHREPKGFSGGQLRLHRIGSTGEEADVVDIDPLSNSLAIFPSWVEHEVREVSCPSGRFEDYRFAVNCWVRCGAA